MCWNYVLAITYEVYYRIKHPYTLNFEGRAKVYHTLSLLLSITYGVVLLINPADNGDSIIGTCFIDKNAFTGALPVYIHLAAITFLSIHTGISLWRVNDLHFLWIQLRFCIVFTATGIPSMLGHNFSYHIKNSNIPLAYTLLIFT